MRTRFSWVAAGVLLALGAVLGLALRGIRFDDPFITYRFSYNLAHGLGFAFNPGDPTPPLITTAPLYALLLALPSALGGEIPAISFGLSVVALVVAAVALLVLGLRHGQPDAGFVAAIVLMALPLAWLTMGFETPTFMAVALLAFVCVAQRRWLPAGVLCGIALGLRGDGAIVAGVCAVFAVAHAKGSPELSRLRAPIKLLLMALVTYAPVALFLTLQFGSPLPSTLQTKSAQAVSGLTGFYVGTTYPEGALLLITAYANQTPWFALVLVFGALGVVRLMALAVHQVRGTGLSAGADVPLLMPAVWAVAHFVGYTLIRVAPYPWYYAPMLPGVAALIGLGVTGAAEWLSALAKRNGQRLQTLFTAVFGLMVFAPLGIGLIHIAGVLNGATPPQPSDVGAKVLPETKVDVYERVGRWLNANTPPTATLGVTELGVMSYYAQRPTVDFLGLTQPSQLSQIRRGDYLDGLLRNQPDYLALTHWNSIYDANPQDDDWFTALYAPVQQFDDPRFWASPMTVWRRTMAPITDKILLAEGAFDMGDGWQVTGVAVSSRSVQANTPLLVHVRLKAGAALGERLLRVQPVTVQRGDGLPSRVRPIRTDLFRAGEEAWVSFPILPYPDARVGAYDIAIRWDSGLTDVFAGRIKVPLNAPADPSATVAPMSSGFGVEMLTAPVESCAGMTATVPLVWRGGELRNSVGQRIEADLSVSVQVRDIDNTLLLEQTSQPLNGTYPTTVWSVGERIPDSQALMLPPNLAPGEYAIDVSLVDAPSGARLPVATSPQHAPDGDQVRVGVLHIGKCR